MAANVWETIRKKKSSHSFYSNLFAYICALNPLREMADTRDYTLTFSTDAVRRIRRLGIVYGYSDRDLMHRIILETVMDFSDDVEKELAVAQALSTDYVDRDRLRKDYLAEVHEEMTKDLELPEDVMLWVPAYTDEVSEDIYTDGDHYALMLGWFPSFHDTLQEAQRIRSKVFEKAKSWRENLMR